MQTRKSLLISFTILIFLGGFRLAAFTQNAINVDYLSKSYNLFSCTSAFLDKSGNVSLANILKDSASVRFTQIQTNSAELLPGQALWLRINLKYSASRDEDWILENILADKTDVYLADTSGKYCQYKTGRLRSYEEQNIKFDFVNHAVCFTLMRGHTDYQIYIRLQNSKFPKVFFYPNLRVMNLDPAPIKWKVDIFWLFQGIFLIMLLYHIFIYLANRQKSYLYYSLYIFCILASYMVSNFFSFLSLGYKLFIYIDLIIILNSSITIFFFQFLRFFVDKSNLSSKTDKILHRWIRIKCFLVLIFIALYHIFSNLKLTFILVNSVLVIETIASLVIVSQLVRKKDNLLRIFGLGTALLFVFSIIGLFFLIKDNSLSHASQVFIQTGVSLQIVIYALGLGYKSHLIEIEKRLAQERLIEQLKENEQLQTKVNRELEDKVRERTLIIETQKEEIQAQADNLKMANIEILKINHDISKQKADIISSIQYASRIQNALLRGEEIFKKHFSHYSIYYRPRDIVSGDFYWLKETEGKIVVAVADCTGHGVPGAFMSILGMVSLNEIVTNNKSLRAGEILDYLRNSIKEALHQTGAILETKDGMDIALCIIDKQNRQLQFAGAHNSLYILHRDTSANEPPLSVIRGDRMPVGISWREEKFKTQMIDFCADDIFIMVTDGITDQTGGEKNGKFKSAQLRELLVQSNNLTFDDFANKLTSSFDFWQQGTQVDDKLCVLFKI
jgi:two-component system, sensor histidine kinase LadS